MPQPSETPFFQLPKPVAVVIATVRLDDGSLVERAPSDLVILPPGLTLPIASLAPVTS